MSKAIVNKLLRQITEAKELQPETVLTLHAVFRDTLFEALHISESKSGRCLVVAKIQSDSGRVIFRVSDLCLRPEIESEELDEHTHTCLLFPNYCSCDTFVKGVILESSALMCRHLLAVAISHALNRTETIQLNDQDFAEHYYSWIA
ncbi:Zinc finger SWIM domain-containing protein 7 [Choanephora cucurbitarum]|uniref:Zinc finger SWIM domain-containing protein 7 n=1 Tax=Choanephora cucurbitarum TaxID=101091 RepID=A0A1C7NQN5_9FUNG|nr:Zinc finger SWIM domain-containing protein 7 [Choanephora cucurbitarum]